MRVDQSDRAICSCCIALSALTAKFDGSMIEWSSTAPDTGDIDNLSRITEDITEAANWKTS